MKIERKTKRENGKKSGNRNVLQTVASPGGGWFSFLFCPEKPNVNAEREIEIKRIDRSEANEQVGDKEEGSVCSRVKEGGKT